MSSEVCPFNLQVLEQLRRRNTLTQTSEQGITGPVKPSEFLRASTLSVIEDHDTDDGCLSTSTEKAKRSSQKVSSGPQSVKLEQVSSGPQSVKLEQVEESTPSEKAAIQIGENTDDIFSDLNVGGLVVDTKEDTGPKGRTRTAGDSVVSQLQKS